MIRRLYRCRSYNSDTMSLRILFTAVLALAGHALSAQSAPDSVQCRVTLAAASRDSVSTRLSIRVSPFDTANRLSASFRGLIGTGIYQFLSVPRPLPLHVYDAGPTPTRPGGTDTAFATLTLTGVYRAILLRDGHLTHIRAVGGTRDEAFDAAVVRALEALSASEMLPPPSPPANTFHGDSLDLRIVITPDGLSFRPSSAAGFRTAEGVTPVLLLRLPIRRVTRSDSPKPGNRPPKYPTDLRNAGIEGKTMFEFVIEANGRVDLTTVQVISATAEQFVKAVIDALPDLRFEPLYVEGCPVPVVARMPFEFSLIRH